MLAMLGCGLTFTACKSNNNDSGLTRMNVRMTDAPGAYDAVNLNVKEVQVFTSEGSSTLDVGSHSFDILDFRLGKDTLIASEDVPSGRLQEVRLVLEDEGNSVVIDGVTYPLTTPSGQSSGVKLKVQDNLVPGVAYTLLLDFDAARSIVQTGNGKYILKPVIRAIPAAVSGVITGTITPVAANPKIYAINGSDTLGTVTDSTGKFWFPGVAAGTYKVEIQPVSPYQTKTISDVSVSNGSVTNLGTITIQ